MAKNNGTAVALYYDAVKIAHLTTNSVSISQSVRDATTKDSAGWEEVLEGLRSAEFSAEGYFEEGVVGTDEILADLITARGTATIRFSSNVAGETYLEATCLVTEYSSDAGLEETQTISATFKVTGAVTLGTVST